MNNKLIRIIGLILVIIFLSTTTFAVSETKTLYTSLLIRGLDKNLEAVDYFGEIVFIDIYNDYDVELFDIKVQESYETNEFDTGDFKAEVLAGSNEVLYETEFPEPDFMVISEEETTLLEYDTVDIYFPYNENSKTLNVYYKDELKLTEDISILLCNKNSICDENENYLSCSQDCHQFSEDGVCWGFSGDKFCDIDCYDDEDCHEGVDNCNDGSIGGNPALCQETCYDGVQNQDEEGIDCGGSCIDICQSILSGLVIAERNMVIRGHRYEMVYIANGVRYSKFITAPISTSLVDIDVDNEQINIVLKSGSDITLDTYSYDVEEKDVEKIYLLKIK